MTAVLTAKLSAGLAYPVGWGLATPGYRTPPDHTSIWIKLALFPIGCAFLLLLLWIEYRGEPHFDRWRDQAAHALAFVAVQIAGPRRLHLLDSWNGDLTETPEERSPLTARRRLRYSRRCVWTAARLRASEALSSRIWCFVLVAMPVSAVSMILLRRGGVPGLVDGVGNLLALGTVATGAIGVLRRVLKIPTAPGDCRRHSRFRRRE